MPTTPLQVFIPGLDNSGLKVCLRPWGQLGAGREEGVVPFCRDTAVVLVNGERLWGKARTATLDPVDLLALPAISA